MLNVAVTGGTGFCGKKVVSQLLSIGCNVTVLGRSDEALSDGVTFVPFDLYNADALATDALNDVDVFVHMAALVHQKGADSDTFLKMNVEATKQIFERCAKAGVKDFVFFSSAAVYGLSRADQVINVSEPTNPLTKYGQTKLTSEIDLIAMGRQYGLGVCIIRLPLIFGADAPGNFGLLSRISLKGIPLPFRNVKNKRSMISVDSLAKFIGYCVQNPKQVEGVHLITDNSVFSTEEILEKLRFASGMSPLLVPFPQWLLKGILTIVGKQTVFDQLFGDLVFESSIDLTDIDCVVGNNDPAYFLK
jgi:nucleoside-diphosphate-sugar epimerase